MRWIIIAICGAFFVWLLTDSILAERQQALFWEAFAAAGQNPWWGATLIDTYFSFTLFYLWIFYREKPWPARVVWLVLVLGLGSYATSGFLVWKLLALPKDEPLHHVMLRPEHRPPRQKKTDSPLNTATGACQPGDDC